jgi:capsid protein
MEIESCLDSREAKIAERGGVPEEVDAAIKRDHDREKLLGIVPVYGNSRVTETVPPGQNEDLAGTEPAPPDSSAPPSPAPGKGKPKP